LRENRKDHTLGERMQSAVRFVSAFKLKGSVGNDPAVSGADPIESRPGFTALLNRIDGNGVRVVLIEDATRFARDLMAQELGIGVLSKLGMRVITANGDDLTETDDHMKVAMRQIAGAFSQLEKARLVAKLKAARDRKRESFVAGLLHAPPVR
jgi:DNA invertase Pin-like site-specific DNA recombinase